MGLMNQEELTQGNMEIPWVSGLDRSFSVQYSQRIVCLGKIGLSLLIGLETSK